MEPAAKMPEFDDTFLFECAKFEKKKWKSYNISLRPSSIVLKSVASFSPNVNNSDNNNNRGSKYLVDDVEGGVIVGGLKPISDHHLKNGGQPEVVLRKRDPSKQNLYHRNGAVNYLYSGVSPIREKILAYQFKRHSYSPGLFAAAAGTSPVPSFGECKYSI